MKPTQPQKTSLLIEISITVIIVLAVVVFAVLFEKPLTYNDGLGWDGGFYYQLAQQIAAGEKIITNAPFVYRIGIPFLVAKLYPDNLLYGFKTINLAGSVLSIVFLLFFLRRFITNPAIRLFLIGIFATHWLGPLRSALFYPTNIESASFSISILAFFLIASLKDHPSIWKTIVFSIVSFAGTLTRESYILIPLVYALSTLMESILTTQTRKLRTLQNLIPSIIPLLFSFSGMLLTHWIATPDNWYPFSRWLLFWMYQKPLLAYLLGYFITLGPMISVIFPAQGIITNYLKTNLFHLYYVSIVSALAWVIGSDTDRFLFWTIPIWLVMFGKALEFLLPVLKKSAGLCFALLLMQCISQRSLLALPDYAPQLIRYRVPVLTVLCNEGCFLDLPSYHGWTGTGIKAALCSETPCYWNGNQLPIKWFQLLEYLFVTGLLTVEIVRRQRILFGEQTMASVHL